MENKTSEAELLKLSCEAWGRLHPPRGMCHHITMIDDAWPQTLPSIDLEVGDKVHSPTKRLGHVLKVLDNGYYVILWAGNDESIMSGKFLTKA